MVLTSGKAMGNSKGKGWLAGLKNMQFCREKYKAKLE